MNRFLSALYREGFWVRRDQGRRLASLIFLFLKCYQLAAAECQRLGKNRFGFTPKIHMLHHSAMRMQHEAEQAQWITNPLSESVQIQEDYIGRPSRLSRRVGMRLLHLRVLQRTLISAEGALRQADRDTRF